MRRMAHIAVALALLLCWIAPAGSVLGPATARAQGDATHAEPEGDAAGHEGEAAGHGDGGHEAVGAIPGISQGLVTGLVSILVFGIVFAVLSVKVWPKIAKGLDERAAKISEEIAAAEAARRQAKDALEEYEKSLANARAEAQRMLEQARADQQKLSADLKAKADKEIAGLRERAMRDIDSARKAALSEIYAESATLATHIASKILAREVNADDQNRLVEESLRELQLASTR